MHEYTCRIEIDVTAATPEEAARQAWDLLAGPEARLPVVDVIDHDATASESMVQDVVHQIDLDLPG